MTVGEREVIGQTPDGLRWNVHVTGGEVTGPRVFGKIRPLSGDWMTIRRDGVAILDVRLTIETNDSALIYVTYSGILDFGEDGYEQSLQGLSRPPIPIRTALRFYTSHPSYLWLNRLLCLGIGSTIPDRRQVAYDVYAVR